MAAESTRLLFDVAPVLVHAFCSVMDSDAGSLGWRSFAARVAPSWGDVRRAEVAERAGRSPTQEVLWTWAQQNRTVGDLLTVLTAMGHQRALSLFSQSAVETTDRMLVERRRWPDLLEPKQPQLSEDSEPPPLRSEYQMESQPSGGRHAIFYSDVIEGTRHFHPDLKIGSGVFYDVYQGKRGNETFTVKLFKQGQNSSWKSTWKKFCIEMEVLHTHQHPNILELWASFSEGDHYCLVYPYMSSGSLFNRLHNKVAQTSVDELTWQQRLGIIKGTAKAVHYLHTSKPYSIICGSISSLNILLNESLQPKLTDFGMACLRPHAVNQTCTTTLDTSALCNLAYLPEEYICDGKLSTRLDVYSFGMVVLETVTGRQLEQDKPSHSLLRDVLWAEAESHGCMDACLCFLDESAGDWPQTVALCLLQLGLDCTSSRARIRPSMEMVLKALSQLLPVPQPPEEEQQTFDDSPVRSGGRQAQTPSLLVEDEEPPITHANGLWPAMDLGPLECSQSEVIYLSQYTREKHFQQSTEGKGGGMHPLKPVVVEPAQTVQADAGEPAVDLYRSWPVQCSCGSDTGRRVCDDCRANTFVPHHSLLQTESPIMASENPAKQRLRNKIQLYNDGFLHTEELLSVAP
ncbi:interleukin-1 receptor-associated kinase 3 [Denticeps clupeoides]|uniref:Protein kinase domain-containing protein n=1 Tax=Denticeps clupeoides TaxID=299321 RepID=A0AAY4EFZ7_9TELE|nr:interleukin-1 receptor-associated kinase 3 [Denticeps clupeoides]